MKEYPKEIKEIIENKELDKFRDKKELDILNVIIHYETGIIENIKVKAIDYIKEHNLIVAKLEENSKINKEFKKNTLVAVEHDKYKDKDGLVIVGILNKK